MTHHIDTGFRKHSGLSVWIAAIICLGATSLHSQSPASTVAHEPSGNLAAITDLNPLPPTVTAPRSVLAVIGGATAFSVRSTGTPTISYQWFFNSNLIAGAIGDSLIVTNVSPADLGAYHVVVANAIGSATSAVARLELDTDGDGLADNWEITYFGSITNQTGTFDRDNDGVSNAAEFRDGSNPTNATSYLPRLTVRAFQGTVLIVPDLERYTNGQSVTVSATPDPGLSFIAWTGSQITNVTTNTITIAMNSNKTLLATCGLPLAPAINVANLVLSGGDAAWYGQTGDSFDGVSAARSGTIEHSQKSWMQLTNMMSGEGTITFRWRTASQFSYDFLTVFVNNVQQIANISGGTNWHQRTYYLTSGVNVIRWEYAKNVHDGYPFDGISLFSTSSGDYAWYTGYYVEAQDAAFVDRVQFEVYANPALDSDGNGLRDLYEYKYFVMLGIDPNADPDNDGVTNLEEAGDGTNPTSNQSARPRVRITVEGGGTATRSPDLASYPQFRYMTNTATAASGWSFVAWAGNLNANFAFGVFTNNPLAVYIDVTKTITAVFGIPLVEATDAAALTWTRGGIIGWYGQTNLTHDGSDAARSAPLNQGGESWMETTVVGPGTLSFWWKCDSITNLDLLTFLINANVQPAQISGVVDWQPQAYYLPSGTHTLRWRFKRGSSSDTNHLNTAWVDQVVFTAGATTPSFVQQPTNLTVFQTSNAFVRVLASGTPPMNYQLFRGATPYGIPRTNAVLVISNVAPAQAGTWTVRASNSAGDMDSQPFTLSVLPVPPLNDNFANRQAFTGLSNAVSGYSFGATEESGEPNHAFSSGGRSVWYSWTPPQTAKYLAVGEDIHATASLIVGVYSGSSVSALTTLGSDSDSGTFTNGALVARPKALFNAVAGANYAIAIDTSYGSGTWFTLAMQLIPPPPNDAFANRIFITGPSVTVFGNNLAATREPGEPSTGFFDGSNSVWWAWTPTRSGEAVATWADSDYSPLISIFTGSTLASLQLVTNSLFSGGDWMRFTASQGIAYVISVDGFGGSSGNIVLNVATVAPALSVGIDPTTGDPVFTLTGAADLDYRIQASTNLVNWKWVATNRAGPDGRIVLPPALSTNSGARFFRAVFP
jgi:hypothetical protein